MRRGTTAIAFFSLAALMLTSARGDAAIPIIDEDAFRLELGGYASNLSGVQHFPYDTGGFFPETSGLSSTLLRFEWEGQIFRDVTFVIHDRFFFNLSSVQRDQGSIGLGASIPPERTVDLRSEILEEENLTLEHDLDRLAFTYYSDVGDVTLGRQAITWGMSTMFTVGDIWTQFSPFELDTSQKRGVDAARLLTYPGDVELEFVVVDRGSVEDLSGGVRAGWVFGRADYYGALAKSWNSLHMLMGTTVDFETFRGHLELNLPYELDEDQLDRPRATVGVDYWSQDLQLGLEYHFNGPGTRDASDYLAQYQSDAVTRGERYFVGRHYVGGLASYRPHEFVTLSSAVVTNIVDPSAIVAPSFQYEIAQDVSGTLGAYLGFGDEPVLSIPPTLMSEYGAVGQLYFMQISSFF